MCFSNLRLTYKLPSQYFGIQKAETKVLKHIQFEPGNLFVWSRNGANKTNPFVKGYSWPQNEDYMGGATC